MLVLGRRVGESVRVGDSVRITVISISGGQVRLGIEAAPEISVHREEVYERIASANLAASSLNDEALEELLVAPQDKESSP